MRVTFPISSGRSFVQYLTTTFASIGGALIKSVFPTPTTFTTASNSVTNNAVRTYFMNSGSAQTLTIPSDTSEIPIGDEICVHVLGAGQLTIAAGSGVTLRKSAATLKSNGQYSAIRIRKLTAVIWSVNGDLAAS